MSTITRRIGFHSRKRCSFFAFGGFEPPNNMKHRQSMSACSYCGKIITLSLILEISLKVCHFLWAPRGARAARQGFNSQAGEIIDGDARRIFFWFEESHVASVMFYKSAQKITCVYDTVPPHSAKLKTCFMRIKLTCYKTSFLYGEFSTSHR